MIRRDPALRDIPVVVHTARELSSDERQRLTTGVREIIAKGALPSSALLDRLEAILPSYRPSAR